MAGFFSLTLHKNLTSSFFIFGQASFAKIMYICKNNIDKNLMFSKNIANFTHKKHIY